MIEVFVFFNSITIVTELPQPEQLRYINEVIADPHGMKDHNNVPVSVPYFDPPPGGFAGDFAADHDIYYWDNNDCSECIPEYRRDRWLVNGKFYFSDSPRDYRLQGDEAVIFKTSLVRLNDSDSYDLIREVYWKLNSNKTVQVCQSSKCHTTY